MAGALTLITVLGALLGLLSGPEGLRLASFAQFNMVDVLDALKAEEELIMAIRAPRVLAAWTAGALLGLAGAIAQGLFRNPLADPYLMGTAPGAALGVVLAAVLSSAAGLTTSHVAADVAAHFWVGLGMTGAAFIGACAGAGLTLLLASGSGRPMALLLCGVVVGVLMAAMSDLLVWGWPQVLRERQSFLLGSTAFVGWEGAGLMLLGLLAALPAALLLSRVLDALVLGELGAMSLGIDLPRLRAALVGLVALCTALAVAHAGLIGFVGLIAPHLVKRQLQLTHATVVCLAALAGGALLLWADVASRTLLAPRELPVGILTAVAGACYLMLLLKRRQAASSQEY